jgi:hypothetical protein
MTPKEKAIDLVEDMHDAPEMGYNEHAKECALIAVDEIILEREVIYASIGIPVGKFWHEVRECIEAM